MTTDLYGNPWARLSDLKPGDTIWHDNGSPCWLPGSAKLEWNGGLYFLCREGQHFLVDQLAEDGDTLIGIYAKEPHR